MEECPYIHYNSMVSTPAHRRKKKKKRDEQTTLLPRKYDSNMKILLPMVHVRFYSEEIKFSNISCNKPMTDLQTMVNTFRNS